MILTDLVVFNFCTFHLKEKMDDHATGRAQACFKAGPSLNLCSAPQCPVPGRFPPSEPTTLKKTEMWKILSQIINKWIFIAALSLNVI